MIRAEAQLPVSRFCELIGLPRRTWYAWRAKHAAGEPAKGPWPAPVVDAIEPDVAKYAEAWPAWGHRKVWAMMRHDGHHVAQTSVRRAMARRGLLLPQRYQAERRELARARRQVFWDEPPTKRNQVWQFDFSEFETASGGRWQLGGCCDYVTSANLACTVTPTATARDMIAALDTAVAGAEELLGHRLIDEFVDPATGEIIGLLAIVTDNGGPMRSAAVARWFAARSWVIHVRTRHRSPGTNGVIERFFESIKYDDLYRHDIADGDALAGRVAEYRHVYNHIRPHEAIGWHRPADAYRQDPTTLKPL